MASVIGSSQRYGNSSGQVPLVSQLAAKNTQQKYQHSQIQYMQQPKENGQQVISPSKTNIDNLYDQSVDQPSSIQVGSSFTIAASQRNSQLSIRDYQINNEINKQSYIKQNSSPWRRNLKNSNNIVIGSKNGFYNQNDTSTLTSLSAQKQQQLSMSPNINKINNTNISQNESQFQNGKNNMSSSYFLHMDLAPTQQEYAASISSKNHYRNHSYQHRNNNLQQNSPLTQQNSIAITNDATPNTVNSNTNKGSQRKSYQHNHQKKLVGGEETVGVSQNVNGDTPINMQQKQKKHPLTARGSVEMSSYQKKLRLHSLNANIHRIFKEDKFQQQLNNQFNSDSTDQQSQKQILPLKDYQTRGSQENISSLQDQSLVSNTQLNNIEDAPSSIINIDEQQNNEGKETIPVKNKVLIEKYQLKEEEEVKEKDETSKIVPPSTENEKTKDLTEDENKPESNKIISLKDHQEIIDDHGYFIQNQDISLSKEKKFQSYTEDTNLSSGSSALMQKNRNQRKGSKTTIKMLHTEPENESRRQHKGNKFKIKNKQQGNHNQQLHTQAEYTSNNSKALALSNSPRNNLNYNYRQRSNTQASTVAIPPQINMGVINGNDQFSPKGSQNESPLFNTNRQKESQEDIYKYGVNSNHLYFINNSPLLKCKVPSNGGGYISGKNGMNAAMKNYINNSLMIKQSYLNIQQQMQGKQCRTQVDSSLSLINQSENKRSPLISKNIDKDLASLQHLSLNQGDSIQQQNYQFSSIDERNQMRDTLSKFQGNLYDKNPVVSSIPLRELENGAQDGIGMQNNEQSHVKNKLAKQVGGGSNQRGNSLQQQQRAYINGEMSNNNNNNNANNRVNSSNKYNYSNKHINTSQDKKQHRIKIRNKIYSTNSSNHSLNASILEKSQLYVEKYKNNLQNDLSLIQKMDKQKQIRENDLYNVNYNDKKLEYAQEIDKKIQYLSHQKIEPSDLRSNQQQRYLQSYSPRMNSNSQAGNYQNFHIQQSSSQNNNPYSPINPRGSTQQNDYNNIHTSLSHITSNDLAVQENQMSDNFIQYIQNNAKNEPSTSTNSNRDNVKLLNCVRKYQDSQLSHIWRKLTYSKEKGKMNQSSLEEELQKIELLSKKNEKALNQYVQIKEDAIQISQFMESHLNQRRARNNSQGDI